MLLHTHYCVNNNSLAAIVLLPYLVCAFAFVGTINIVNTNSAQKQ